MVTNSAHGGQGALGDPLHVASAPAKLTLSLQIVGVRPDGYHLLDAEMVTIDLADSLEIYSGDGLEVVGDHAKEVPTDDSNLVRRALAAAGRLAFVRVHKRIPAGAGLGGGSADAAAVLRWGGVEDRSVAAGLGSDVAFCLAGGRARVTGAGELIEHLPFEEVAGQAYTLLIPPFGVSTAAVYKAWDGLGGPRNEGPNDLEQAALAVEPRLAEWRERLRDATGETPVLAGSGSTWYVAGEFAGPGLTVVRVTR